MPNLNSLVIAVLILAGTFIAGHHQAYLEQQAEIERISEEMKIEADKQTTKLKKEKQDAEIKINQLRADAASGALRLSVRANCAASTPGGNAEARAELDGQTAQDLIAITADGDQAIIELNSCIDLYNNLRNVK